MVRVLVPVDASPDALLAVRRVIREFREDRGLHVHLLNVQRPFARYVARFLSQRQMDDYLFDRSRQVLRPVRDLLDDAHVPYVVHSAIGEPAAAITEAARRLRCDHIVMSPRRKGLIVPRLGGSVSQRVIATTVVRVELVPGRAASIWERFVIPRRARRC